MTPSPEALAVIAALGLDAHPEGGHYRQTWRDDAGTAIYFLLTAGERSGWHRVHGRAEIWHYYAGAPVLLEISVDGTTISSARLGTDFGDGQLPQAVVPAGAWQSAVSEGPWSLVGCTVSPPFAFEYFELAPASWAPEGLSPLVSPGWLAGRMAAGSSSDLVVADVRWYLDGRSGAAAFEAGHIPGAVWIDLDRVLAGRPSAAAGRHPLPDPVRFAEGMAAAGISDTTTVVAYDDQNGVVAARLVWLLRALGRPAALLDGGLGSWSAGLEVGPGTTAGSGRFEPAPWPDRLLAGIDEVAAGVGTLIDARAPERFNGDHEPVDPRAGHIPGAVNVPTSANLDDNGRFRPGEELRATFGAAGVRPGDDVVVYCGSGVSACLDLLALDAAGLGPGRLYPGSWSQWSSDPSRAAEVGPATPET